MVTVRRPSQCPKQHERQPHGEPTPIEAPDFNHFEMCESFGKPYSPNGVAALKMMKIA
jgi:hypothetical protein